MEKKEMLSPKEVAEILGIHKSRIYELIDRGDLPAYDYNMKKGGNRFLRIRRSDVEAFLSQCRCQAVQTKPTY